jgi:DNA-binding NarL/FixJ family response regulator
MNWLTKMNIKAFDVLFGYPEFERKNLEATYDLIAHTKIHKEIILRHTLIPYKLCNNGNLWMALCYVTPESSVQTPHKAKITNIKTGETHHYIKDTFVLSESKVLTMEEIKILELLSTDVPPKNVYEMLGISERCFHQKKQKIFDKLNVQSWIAAVHQAHKLKIL